MKNKNPSVSKRSQSGSSIGSVEVLDESPDFCNSPQEVVNSTQSNLKEEVVTNKFRELLIYGSEKEALGKLSQIL